MSTCINSLTAFRTRVRQRLLELYRGQRARSIEHASAMNIAIALAKRDFPSVSTDVLRQHLADELNATGEPGTFGGLLLS